jgi:hypothetical protein
MGTFSNMFCLYASSPPPPPPYFGWCTHSRSGYKKQGTCEFESIMDPDPKHSCAFLFKTYRYRNNRCYAHVQLSLFHRLVWKLSCQISWSLWLPVVTHYGTDSYQYSYQCFGSAFIICGSGSSFLDEYESGSKSVSKSMLNVRKFRFSQS